MSKRRMYSEFWRMRLHYTMEEQRRAGHRITARDSQFFRSVHQKNGCANHNRLKREAKQCPQSVRSTLLGSWGKQNLQKLRWLSNIRFLNTGFMKSNIFFQTKSSSPPITELLCRDSFIQPQVHERENECCCYATAVNRTRTSTLEGWNPNHWTTEAFCVFPVFYYILI